MSDLIGPELAFGFRQLGLTAGYGYVERRSDARRGRQREAYLDSSMRRSVPVTTAPERLRFALSASDTAERIGGSGVVSGDLAIDIDTPAGRITGGISGGLAPLIFTKDSVTFASTGMTGPVQLQASVAFQTDAAAAPALRLGSASGTRLEIGVVKASVGLSSDAQQVDVLGAVDLKDVVLAIRGGDGDGFLAACCRLTDWPRSSTSGSRGRPRTG